MQAHMQSCIQMHTKSLRLDLNGKFVHKRVTFLWTDQPSDYRAAGLRQTLMSSAK